MDLILLGMMSGIGTTMVLIGLNSWKDLEAKPEAALRAVAKAIETDPVRIINLLDIAAEDIIKPESLDSPVGYARALIEEIINGKLKYWIVPDDFANRAEGEQPINYSLANRQRDAIRHTIWFKSVADNLRQGPTSVANVVAALRSAADRVKAAGGMMPRPPGWGLSDMGWYESGVDTFNDVVWDTSPILSPSLNSSWHTDPRSNLLLAKSSTMTPLQKRERDAIINWNAEVSVYIKMCELGWIYELNDISQKIRPNCTYSGNKSSDFTAWLAQWMSGTLNSNGSSSSSSSTSSRVVSYRKKQMTPYNNF
jgi:hypothetical protein